MIDLSKFKNSFRDSKKKMVNFIVLVLLIVFVVGVMTIYYFGKNSLYPGQSVPTQVPTPTPNVSDGYQSGEGVDTHKEELESNFNEINTLLDEVKNIESIQ